MREVYSPSVSLGGEPETSGRLRIINSRVPRGAMPATSQPSCCLALTNSISGSAGLWGSRLTRTTVCDLGSTIACNVRYTGSRLFMDLPPFLLYPTHFLSRNAEDWYSLFYKSPRAARFPPLV